MVGGGCLQAKRAGEKGGKLEGGGVYIGDGRMEVGRVSVRLWVP